MTRRDGPRQGRLWWPLRRTGLTRNPMRRGTDRIQAVTRAGLLVVFLAGAPAAAAFANHVAYVSGLRAAQVQAAAWHPVPAVVLRATPLLAVWLRPARPFMQVSVRWAVPGGSSHVGEITGVDAVMAGSTTTVWIDEAGRLAHPPLSRAVVAGRAIHAAVAAVVVLVLLLAAVSRVVSLVLDRYRLARWGAGWAAVEPQWSGRR